MIYNLAKLQTKALLIYFIVIIIETHRLYHVFVVGEETFIYFQEIENVWNLFLYHVAP